MIDRWRILVTVGLLGVAAATHPPARADPIDPIPVAVAMTDGGTGFHLGGKYTSPYVLNISGSIDDTGLTWGITLALACDDIGGEVAPGEAWTAQAMVANPSDLTSSTGQMYTNASQVNYGMSVGEAYDIAGLLAYDIIKAYTSGPTAYDGDGNPTAFGGWDSDQFGVATWALWSLFDPSWQQIWNPQGADDGSSLNIANAVANELSIYTAAYNQGDSVRLAILTPDDKTYQEFLGIAGAPDFDPVSWNYGAPEGSSLAFLAFDLLAVFGGIFLVRKRILAS